MNELISEIEAMKEKVRELEEVASSTTYDRKFRRTMIMIEFYKDMIEDSERELAEGIC